MPVKTGYIANWKNYPTNEVKVRVARPGPLGVPKDLWKLIKAKKIRWEEYERRYLLHVMMNKKAHAKLMEIMKLLKAGKTVRLICYEKDPLHCHRTILKKAIEGLIFA